MRDGHGPARLLTGAAPLSPHQHEARVTTESAGIQIITGVQVSVVSLTGGGGGGGGGVGGFRQSSGAGGSVLLLSRSHLRYQLITDRSKFLK